MSDYFEDENQTVQEILSRLSRNSELLDSWFEDLQSSGLLEPYDRTIAENDDLPDMALALSFSWRLLLTFLRSEQQALKNHSKILVLIQLLKNEVARLHQGLDSPALSVSKSIEKNSVALDPERQILRQYALGCSDILSLRVTRKASYEFIASLITSLGVNCSPKTIEKWRSNNNYDSKNRHRLQARSKVAANHMGIGRGLEPDQSLLSDRVSADYIKQETTSLISCLFKSIRLPPETK